MARERSVAAFERDMMREAMKLAAERHPHPNPRVGAVVVSAEGVIVGRGAHAAPGTPHAEPIALAEAGEAARGGTLVVTLEPCVHEGRTPPCTTAVIAAGISRVVIGAVDPDEHVQGRGIVELRRAGVEVVVGVPGIEAESVDPGFFHHRRTGLPLVTLKLASTLDGQVAARDRSSRWITSEAARRDAHRLRARSDGVLVGAGTVLADDPALTARLGEDVDHQPRPIVVVGERPVPATAAVFTRDPLVYARHEVDLPGEVTVLPGEGGVDLGAMMADLGKRGLVDLLVEGGPTLAGSLVRSGLIDRCVVYFAAALAGGAGVPMLDGTFEAISELMPVRITGVSMVGPDIRVEAEVE
jgi:diaminohydroxyphosphoribosylaminopyrimidine deaminase/5-amino-6-(5-phosphoribosylamino)uracil reductase